MLCKLRKEKLDDDPNLPAASPHNHKCAKDPDAHRHPLSGGVFPAASMLGISGRTLRGTSTPWPRQGTPSSILVITVIRLIADPLGTLPCASHSSGMVEMLLTATL